MAVQQNNQPKDNRPNGYAPPKPASTTPATNAQQFVGMAGNNPLSDYAQRAMPVPPMSTGPMQGAQTIKPTGR